VDVVWQLLSAAAGLVGLLLLWSTLIVAIAAVVLFVVGYVPIVSRTPGAPDPVLPDYVAPDPDEIGDAYDVERKAAVPLAHTRHPR
jgi:hypothetical protein